MENIKNDILERLKMGDTEGALKWLEILVKQSGDEGLASSARGFEGRFTRSKLDFLKGVIDNREHALVVNQVNAGIEHLLNRWIPVSNALPGASSSKRSQLKVRIGALSLLLLFACAYYFWNRTAITPASVAQPQSPVISSKDSSLQPKKEHNPVPDKKTMPNSELNKSSSIGAADTYFNLSEKNVRYGVIGLKNKQFDRGFSIQIANALTKSGKMASATIIKPAFISQKIYLDLLEGRFDRLKKMDASGVLEAICLVNMDGIKKTPINAPTVAARESGISFVDASTEVQIAIVRAGGDGVEAEVSEQVSVPGTAETLAAKAIEKRILELLIKQL